MTEKPWPQPRKETDAEADARAAAYRRLWIADLIALPLRRPRKRRR